MHKQRLQLAAKILHDYLRQQAPPPLDVWLQDLFRTHRQLGKQDRHWYSESLFSFFRCAPAFINHTTGVDVQASALRQQLATLNLEEILADLPNSVSAPGRQYLAPYEWRQLDLRRQSSGWDEAITQRFQEMQGRRPPTWLRLAKPQFYGEVIAELTRIHLPPRRHEQALAIAALGDFKKLPCFKSGHIEIQDFASQQLGAALPLKPNAVVWDMCAGAGGKALQLAARLQGEGSILVTDNRPEMLDELRERAQRGGWGNIRFSLKAKEFDAVLVDAPCSGSGTWRRSPDGRLRTDTSQLGKFTATQIELLRQAAPAVKVGGYLEYATCSWWVKENEGVADQFLIEHPNFKPIKRQLVGCPQQDSDTMFFALWQRLR